MDRPLTTADCISRLLRYSVLCVITVAIFGAILVVESGHTPMWEASIAAIAFITGFLMFVNSIETGGDS